MPSSIWQSKPSASLICFVVICFLVSAPSIGLSDDSRPSQTDHLVFLTWSDYIDPELIRAFEQSHDCRIKQVHYETDELRHELLIETNGTGYDLILGAGITLSPYVKCKWIIPLTNAAIPNLKHIDPKWLTAYPGISGYAVPYLWGTTGIVYRRDLIPDRIDSWFQLYRPAEYLRGKIIMINDSRDLFNSSLKALGFSINTVNPEESEQAARLLTDQKPFVQDYSYIRLTPDSSLVTGKSLMAMAYNGDALILQQYHPDIQYVVPKEGTNIWMDYLVIPKSSSRQQLAMKFINFLHEPENAARLSLYTKFATPNRSAERYLPPDHLNNALIYPGPGVLEQSEVSKELPPDILRYRNIMISNIINRVD